MARLLVGVTRALVDRWAVDWNAVLSRTRTDTDRAMIEALRSIEVLCAGQSVPSTARVLEQTGTRHLLLVQSVLALALAQVLCSSAILLAAFASHQVPDDRLPQILLACAFAGGSLFLATCAKTDQRTIYLAAWFACVASAFARHSLTGLPVPSSDPIQFVLRSVVPEAFMPACVWQFAVTFPRVQRFAQFDVLARRATVAAWALGSALFGINFVEPYVPIELAGLDPLLRSHPSKMFWHVITLAIGPAIGTIFVRAGRAPADERRKVIRLSAAIAIGSAPFLVLGVFSAASARFSRWIATSSPSERFGLDAIVIAGLIATPLLSAMAVIVDRPFELRRTLSWAWRHALGRGIVELILVAPLALLAFELYGLRHLSVQQVFSSTNAWLLAACIVAIALASTGRGKLLRALDRHESHRAREHHQQLVRALARIRTARGTREMGMVLRQQITAGTGATRVKLLVPEAAGSGNDLSIASGSWPRDGALMAMFDASPGPIDVTPSGVGPLLPHSDREWVIEQNVELLMPVKHRDDEIAAVLALGPKRGGAPFDDQDRWLLTNIAAAAAAAWTESEDASSPPNGRTKREDGEVALECPSCGLVSDALPLACSCSAPVTLAALPHRVGDHLIVTRRIGAGGMGVVYLARDVALDREVALKTLPLLAPGAVARLQDEARAMAALNHPSLATIFGVEIWRRTPILIVEYFLDGTLASRLTRGPLPADESLRIGVTMAGALSYVHAHGLLHRDLKPSNIGRTATGAAKLLDFGLASVVAEPRTAGEATAAQRTAAPIGTRAYLPPEAVSGAAASPAVDLWALAVVLLECMTGANPFARDRVPTSAHVDSSHDELVRSALHAVTPSLRPFFNRALAHDPTHRFQRAEELRSALADIAVPMPS